GRALPEKYLSSPRATADGPEPRLGHQHFPGIAPHRETLRPADQPSVYAAPGAEFFCRSSSAGAPASDWHPSASGFPAAEKAAPPAAGLPSPCSHAENGKRRQEGSCAALPEKCLRH